MVTVSRGIRLEVAIDFQDPLDQFVGHNKSANRFEFVALVQQHGDQAADGLDGLPISGLRPKLAPVVQTQNSAIGHAPATSGSTMVSAFSFQS